MSWSVEETIDVVMRDQMPLLQQELASSAAEFFAVVRERGCSLPFVEPQSKLGNGASNWWKRAMCLGGGLRTILSSQRR